MFWFYLEPASPVSFVRVVRVTTQESPQAGDLLGTTEAEKATHKAIIQLLLSQAGHELTGYKLTYEEIPDVPEPDAPAPEPDS